MNKVKAKWENLENKILTVYTEKKEFYFTYLFAFPKCCCEVVEE